MDEGYIKFNADWKKAPPIPAETAELLNQYRQQLYLAGLVGAYDNGIGYGNISKRLNQNGQFIISGSKTGLLPKLSNAHYSRVLSFDLDKNQVSCEGPIIASSESMSHAVIYQYCLEVNAVIHGHHKKLWETLLNKVPTTESGATYGSPEMGYSIIDLLNSTDLMEKRIFVMAGHEEGIFTFGKNLESAATLMLQYANGLH